MKYFRATLIAAVFAAASIGFGVASAIEQGGEQQEPSACQKCGDGFCARSCENERTCPQDCGPRPATAH